MTSLEFYRLFMNDQHLFVGKIRTITKNDGFECILNYCLWFLGMRFVSINNRRRKMRRQVKLKWNSIITWVKHIMHLQACCSNINKFFNISFFMNNLSCGMNTIIISFIYGFMSKKARLSNSLNLNN